MSSPIRFSPGLIVAGIVACLLLVFSSRHRNPPTSEVATSPSEVVAQRQPDESMRENKSTPTLASTASSAETGIEPPPLKLDTMPALGEQQLASTIAGQTDPTAKARAIFASLSHLPEEALGSATEEAVKNLPDSSYAIVALPVVINEHTHGQVMSVLFADLMERPDSITLPALLAIARNPSHPFSASAVDNLKLLLRENHGNDWQAWNASIQKRLAAPPK